jgi:hypothetical protein
MEKTHQMIPRYQHQQGPSRGVLSKVSTDATGNNDGLLSFMIKNEDAALNIFEYIGMSTSTIIHLCCMSERFLLLMQQLKNEKDASFPG